MACFTCLNLPGSFRGMTYQLIHLRLPGIVKQIALWGHAAPWEKNCNLPELSGKAACYTKVTQNNKSTLSENTRVPDGISSSLTTSSICRQF